MKLSASLEKPLRQFLPSEFLVTDWASLEPYLKELLSRGIQSREELEKWLKDLSELESVLSEDSIIL